MFLEALQKQDEPIHLCSACVTGMCLKPLKLLQELKLSDLT